MAAQEEYCAIHLAAMLCDREMHAWHAREKSRRGRSPWNGGSCRLQAYWAPRFGGVTLPWSVASYIGPWSNPSPPIRSERHACFVNLSSDTPDWCYGFPDLEIPPQPGVRSRTDTNPPNWSCGAGAEP